MSPAARPAFRPDRAAPVFAALGDPTRLGVVARLSAGGPLSATALAGGAKVTRQAVSKHLRVLEDAGLVEAARRGREQRWALRPERLEEARAQLDLVARRWDDALARLAALVEGG